MEYYDYQDWIGWPEFEIRAYARELAVDLSLTVREADFLEERMAERAGYWSIPPTKPRFGPFRLSEKSESDWRELGESEHSIFNKNVALNRPWSRQKIYPEDLRESWKKIGGGLTAKFFRETSTSGRSQLARERRKLRREDAKHPFSALHARVRNWSNDALWLSNCLPISYGGWIIRKEAQEPFEGLVWYSDKLLECYQNARKQADIGNMEAAMWHAFRAGELAAELQIRVAHSELFDRYSATNSAQKDAAKARKIVSDDSRREAYWRFRNAGHKRVEAGRLAGEELGLSEASIRNAFPDSRYPPE